MLADSTFSILLSCWRTAKKWRFKQCGECSIDGVLARSRGGAPNVVLAVEADARQLRFGAHQLEAVIVYEDAGAAACLPVDRHCCFKGPACSWQELVPVIEFHNH